MEINGSPLYQLQREISSISQKDLTVIQYFTKLKKLWDELSCLQLLPHLLVGLQRSFLVLTHQIS